MNSVEFGFSRFGMRNSSTTPCTHIIRKRQGKKKKADEKSSIWHVENDDINHLINFDISQVEDPKEELNFGNNSYFNGLLHKEHGNQEAKQFSGDASESVDDGTRTQYS